MLHYVSRLYLGRNIPGTPHAVKPFEFDNFIRDTITPAFPDGFTLYEGRGGWRDITNSHTIHEATMILEVYHTGSVDARRKIKDIAVTYRQRFGQDAVMISTFNLSEGVDFV